MRSILAVLAFLAVMTTVRWEPAPVAAQQTFAATEEFVVVRGSTLWDLALEKCGNALRWREIYDINPNLEAGNRLSVRSGRPYVMVYPGERLTIPVVGCELASTIVIAASETRAVQTPPPSPQLVEKAVVPWWAWLLLVATIVAIAYLLVDRRRLKQYYDGVITGLQEQITRLNELLQGAANRRAEATQEAAEREAATRPPKMPEPAPGFDNPLSVGVPFAAGGVTAANRAVHMEREVRETYRLSRGEALRPTDRIEFDDWQRKLLTGHGQVNSLDGRSRELDLLREPAYMATARILRGGELIETLPDQIILEICANGFRRGDRVIGDFIVEDYDPALMRHPWETTKVFHLGNQVVVVTPNFKVSLPRMDETIIEHDEENGVVTVTQPGRDRHTITSKRIDHLLEAVPAAPVEAEPAETGEQATSAVASE